MGHSYSSEDLMYMSTDNNNSFYAPYRSSFQYLSSKDINTLKLLYKMIPNITNTPLEEFKTRNLIYPPIILGTSKQINSRKLKEALNYIKKAPDLSGGYVDLAVAYAESNRNNDALKALNAAFFYFVGAAESSSSSFFFLPQFSPNSSFPSELKCNMLAESSIF